MSSEGRALAEGVDWEAVETRTDAESVESLLALDIGSYGFYYGEDEIFVPLFDGVSHFKVPISAALKGKDLCISGSREFNDWELVRLGIKSLPCDVGLITGGARGVGREAYLAGKEFHLNQEVIYAEWDKYGKSAGVIRNIQMIDMASDVVAFWDMKSSGTKHAIQYAASQGKLRFVFPPRERWQEYNEQKDRRQYVPLPMRTATDFTENA